MSDKPLPKRLQPALRAIEKDLLERAKLPGVEAGLRAAWEAEKNAGETGQSFDPWRRARVTQIAAAWVLSVVFVRTLEDRGFIDPRIAGPDANGLVAARDREAAFVQITPFLGPREYLLAVFRELAHLPGTREIFDARHNPVWILAPSNDGARALLNFFQQVEATTGAPVFTFPGTDTRFLGDLYQNLSEAVRKRYALLQTPDFVEKFILEQTLHPAIEEFGLAEVKLIDPTCGSGHFLLGAFRELLAAWRKHEPVTPIEELAGKALTQVHGVDINPYAVAIARFRLVLAVLEAVGIQRLDRAPELRPKIVVADSLLHRLKEQQQRLSQQLTMDEWADWGDALFKLSEPGAVADLLGQRYHAVVGNPPYIVEKDDSKKARYKDLYDSASGKFALSAPFTERFFELAVADGFVGLINSNAWTKRDFGEALIVRVLPRFCVTKVVDTSGCYLPGHGTPTLLLFGRQRTGLLISTIAVLGKRGEQEVPASPSDAPVWSEIIAHHNDLGFEGKFISVEHFDSSERAAHPWVMAGGGARRLLADLGKVQAKKLGSLVAFLGRTTHTGDDPFFIVPETIAERHLGTDNLVPLVQGQDVADWQVEANASVLFPYDKSTAKALALSEREWRYYWPYRSRLRARRDFKQTIEERGLHWYEHSMFFPDRYVSPTAIGFGEISTHNSFVISRGARVFNRTAPAMTLKESMASEGRHRGLAGYLNSSLVAFWGRLNFFQKGGDQAGEGARLSKTPWQDRLQMGAKILKQLPVPDLDRLDRELSELVAEIEATANRIDALNPVSQVGILLSKDPSAPGLRSARSALIHERAELRQILVSLQEEIDWRVYGIFGLPTVTASSVKAVTVPIDPTQRPFEIRLGREVATDISASEWFRVHKRNPPSEVKGPLVDLFRQRLRLLDDTERGRRLRLLETPGTKRRWSSPDDAKAFRDALRDWLLARVEDHFRRTSTPVLCTVRQIALDLSRDPAIQAAHELLTEEAGHDLVHLLSNLCDEQGIPHLTTLRFTESGMEKRAAWEEMWRLQRLEDAGKLQSELARMDLPAISLPDKYARGDYQRHYWNLRKALDTPRERFITVPGGSHDDDPTLLVGWAGWDHLQTAQALAALYQRRKDEDGWAKQRLLPLLAGIAERVPWLLQWHDQPNDAYGGMRLGQFFRDFVSRQAHALGVAVDFTKATDDLRSFTPSAAPKRNILDPDELYAALLRWKPEVDEDAEDEEEAEPPEGPTAEELASEVGATKALVNKALKKLLADGRIEKLDGRPARYAATGDDA